MTCKHPHIAATIEILTQLTVGTSANQPQIIDSQPLRIKVTTFCYDCQKPGVFHAYRFEWTESGGRWPGWLLTRMTALRRESLMLDAACRACYVPPEFVCGLPQISEQS